MKIAAVVIGGILALAIIPLTFIGAFASAPAPIVATPVGGIGTWGSLPFQSLYLSAAAQCQGLPPEVLAATHNIESGSSGDTSVVSSAGAKGPMQFEPGTWLQYASPGANITSVVDSMYAAARMFCANGAGSGTIGSISDALHIYNCGHVNCPAADAYTAKVLNIAITYANQAADQQKKGTTVTSTVTTTVAPAP